MALKKPKKRPGPKKKVASVPQAKQHRVQDGDDDDDTVLSENEASGNEVSVLAKTL